MDNRPVLFYDSGIGGLCYGLHFRSRNRREKLVCAGDRANFPYGVKSREELIEITTALTKKIISVFNPKIMAIACNAASVSALAHLRAEFPDLPIVGTVPAIKPAVLASKKRCIGVLGTNRTNSDPYIEELVSRHGPDCTVVKIAAPELAEFIEHRWTDADQDEKMKVAGSYIEQFSEKGADTVVLACTHFPFLLDEFRAAAGDNMKIFDSVEGISNRVESLLEADGLRSGSNTEQQAIMAVTGKEPLEPYWKKLTGKFGFKLELM